MTRKIFMVATLVAVMVILAACGTAAKPAYEPDAIIAEAQETVAANAEHVEATEEPVVETTEEAVVEETEEPVVEATEEAVVEETEEPVVEATEEAVSEEGEETAIGADDPLFEAVSAADATNGEQLFLINGCVGCHSVDSSGMTIVGPGQYGLIDRVGERVEGEGPYTYIYNSIVNPNDYVVEGFASNLMPPNFGDLLTEEQIYDIIAYLVTLHD